MKQVIPVLFAAVVVMLAACSGSKKKSSDELPVTRPATMVFTENDTTEINQMVNTFVEYINSGKISDASAMLYTVQYDRVEEMTLEERQKFEGFFTTIPYKSCEVKSFHLGGAKDNKVQLALLMTPDANLETGRGIIKLVLNPVNVEGKWYLTLRDEDAEGIEHENI